MADKIWVETLKSHLTLANEVASRLPAGERLKPKDLNEILDMVDQFKATFLLQCRLWGFEVKKGA